MTDFVVNGIYLFTMASAVAMTSMVFPLDIVSSIANFSIARNIKKEEDEVTDDEKEPWKSRLWWMVPLGWALTTIVAAAIFLSVQFAGGNVNTGVSVRSIWVMAVASIIAAQTALDTFSPITASAKRREGAKTKISGGFYQFAQTLTGVALLVFPVAYFWGSAPEKAAILPVDNDLPIANVILVCALLNGAVFGGMRALHIRSINTDKLKKLLSRLAQSETGGAVVRLDHKRLDAISSAHAARPAAETARVNGRSRRLDDPRTASLACAADVMRENCRARGLAPTVIDTGEEMFATNHAMAARLLKMLPTGSAAFAAKMRVRQAEETSLNSFGSSMVKGIGSKYVDLAAISMPFNAGYEVDVFGNMPGFVQTLAMSPFEAMSVTACWLPFWIFFYGRVDHGVTVWLTITLPPFIFAAMSSWNFFWAYFRYYLLGYCFYVSATYEGWTSDDENILAGNATFMDFEAGAVLTDNTTTMTGLIVLAMIGTVLFAIAVFSKWMWMEAKKT